MTARLSRLLYAPSAEGRTTWHAPAGSTAASTSAAPRSRRSSSTHGTRSSVRRGSPTPTTGGPTDVVAEMAAALRQAAEAAGVALEQVVAVGVGAPGAANTETGRARPRAEPSRLARGASARGGSRPARRRQGGARQRRRRRRERGVRARRRAALPVDGRHLVGNRRRRRHHPRRLAAGAVAAQLASSVTWS